MVAEKGQPPAAQKSRAALTDTARQCKKPRGFDRCRAANVKISRLSKVFLLLLHYCTETLYVLARTLAKETREQNCFRSCQNYINSYVHVAHINVDSRDPLILISYNKAKNKSNNTVE